MRMRFCAGDSSRAGDAVGPAGAARISFRRPGGPPRRLLFSSLAVTHRPRHGAYTRFEAETADRLLHQRILARHCEQLGVDLDQLAVLQVLVVDAAQYPPFHS